MVTFTHSSHRFDINWSTWSGMEEISYDGKVMSKKRNLWDMESTHEFQVSEDQGFAHYMVVIKLDVPLQVEVRRNGILIFSRKQGGVIASNQSSMFPETQAAPTTPVEKRIVRETIIREVILVVCSHCGHRNDSSKRSCEKCGASI